MQGTLKMEGLCSAKKLVTSYQTTQYHKLEDHNMISPFVKMLVNSMAL
jgi:hypothetical protein